MELWVMTRRDGDDERLGHGFRESSPPDGGKGKGVVS
jgi:hypothetical protein